MTIGDAVNNIFLTVFGFVEFLLRFFLVLITFGLVYLFSDGILDCQLWSKLK